MNRTGQDIMDERSSGHARRSDWSVLLSLGLLGGFTCVLVTAEVRAADGATELTSKIELMIDHIKAERSSTVRTEVVQRLSAMLQHQDYSDVDILEARPIDDIAGLLSDRDDSVRYWAAMALGQIGPPAGRAVPALERALREVEASTSAIVAAKTSESGIRFAVRTITGKPGSFRGFPLAKCIPQNAYACAPGARN
jgi:hypothetical protein